VRSAKPRVTVVARGLFYWGDMPGFAGMSIRRR